jgi:hypothetical protein
VSLIKARHRISFPAVENAPLQQKHAQHTLPQLDHAAPILMVDDEKLFATW